MIEPAVEQAGVALSDGDPHGDWVVTLDVEGQRDQAVPGELALRSLSAAVAGSRTYISAREYGYSFTAILRGAGAQVALAEALERLALAQRAAGLPTAGVVCAEVTLVAARPVPAAAPAKDGCNNSAS